MNTKTLKTNFERVLLFQIILNLRKNRISSKRAQVVAKAFIPIMLQELNSNELLEKLSRLSQFYPEISEAYLVVAREYEESQKKEKLPNISEMLLNGDVDAALKLLKGGVN